MNLGIRISEFEFGMADLGPRDFDLPSPNESKKT